MNTLFEAPAHEAETFDLHRQEVGVARKSNGSPPQHGFSKLRGLNVTVRSIDSRCDDLEQKHWKKVWRFMQND